MMGDGDDKGNLWFDDEWMNPLMNDVPGIPEIKQVQDDNGTIQLEFTYPLDSKWTDEMREEFEAAAKRNIAKAAAKMRSLPNAPFLLVWYKNALASDVEEGKYFLDDYTYMTDDTNLIMPDGKEMKLGDLRHRGSAEEDVLDDD